MKSDARFSKKYSKSLNCGVRKLNSALAMEIVACLVVIGCILTPQIGNAGPVINDEGWSDTFDDVDGVDFSYNVNISDSDVKLKEYRNNFNEEILVELPAGWTREYSSSNYFEIRDDPYEPGRAVFLHCNDAGSSFAWQKLWIEYNEYYQFWEFDLTLFAISVETEREGYFYIEFYNATDDVYHEVRYYWDDARSGTPPSSTSLTAVDLGFVLPTGVDLGTKFLIHENISEDIEANPQAGLTSVLENITKVRYGFYQDAGPGWDRWEQVYIDNMGIYNDNFGYLTSINISIPMDYAWISFQVNKTEPKTETYINITIIDGDTGETILGFQDLTSTNIDMSSIDPLTYQNITLQANLTGTGNATPILHDWVISWGDVGPPATPEGLVVSNPLNGYSLILSWYSNIEQDLAFYRIYYSIDNISFSWLTDVPAGGISFIHYGLTTGVPYYYKISAVDDSSNPSPNTTVVSDIPDIDTDNDGIGNIADPDDDNDGIPDISDQYPYSNVNDMEATIDNINDTVDEIQNRIIDIQLDIDSMNVTLGYLEDAIEYLNQTISIKIDDLALQLAEVNDSILSRVFDAEFNILEYLRGLNTSLSEDIQNLLNNMTIDHDSLRNWLEQVIGAIDANLTVTNITLHQQLGDMGASIVAFHNNLSDDIDDIQTELQMHDQITGEDHSEIIAMLEDLRTLKHNDLKTKLINLAENLSEHNQSIADDIWNVVNDIDAFEADTNRQLQDINSTLAVLSKLEIILNDLEALDQSLDAMEDELQDSIDDISTEEEDEERYTIIELLLIIIILLLIANLILTIQARKHKKKAAEGDIPERETLSEQTPSLPPLHTSSPEEMDDREGLPKPENKEIKSPPPPPK